MNLWIAIFFPLVLTEAHLIVKTLKERGYPVEVYSVFTPDGFKIKLHQIPHGKNVTGPTKGSIILVHSLLSSGAEWLWPEENRAMAFIAANSGYDVWLFNARGTSYSSYHKEYNITDSRYWDYSFHEIGIYDLKTSIDFILKKTGRESINLVGYSQGGTSTLVLLSTLPEYNKKINHAFLIGPAAFIGSMSMLGKIMTEFAELSLKFGVNGLITSKIPFVETFTKILCGNGVLTTPICYFYYSLFVGTHTRIAKNVDFFPELVRHIADIFSFKELEHFGQLSSSEKFQQFDYGTLKNEEIYGSKEPPSYNLSAITTPVTIIYGSYDALCKPNGQRRLIKELPNSGESFEVPYNHFDIFCGKDVEKLIYQKIIEILEIKRKF